MNIPGLGGKLVLDDRSFLLFLVKSLTFQIKVVNITHDTILHCTVEFMMAPLIMLIQLVISGYILFVKWLLPLRQNWKAMEHLSKFYFYVLKFIIFTFLVFTCHILYIREAIEEYKEGTVRWEDFKQNCRIHQQNPYRMREYASEVSNIFCMKH